MLYSRIVNGQPQQPGSLPLRIRLSNGTTKTHLYELSTQELIALEIYPVEENKPPFDSNIEQLVLDDLQLVAGEKVIAFYRKELLPRLPNWTAWRTEIMGSSLFVKISEAPFGETLFDLIWQLNNGNSSVLGNIQNLWPVIAASIDLSEEEKEFLLLKTQEYNLPSELYQIIQNN